MDKLIRKFLEDCLQSFGKSFSISRIVDCIYELGETLDYRNRFLKRLQLSANLQENMKQSVESLFSRQDIVFITPEYRGVSMAGGIATMLGDFCECLATMGQPVTVITPYYTFNAYSAFKSQEEGGQLSAQRQADSVVRVEGRNWLPGRFYCPRIPTEGGKNPVGEQ